MSRENVMAIIKAIDLGRKQGALEELEEVYNVLLSNSSSAEKIRKYIEERLKELKEGVEKWVRNGFQNYLEIL